MTSWNAGVRWARPSIRRFRDREVSDFILPAILAFIYFAVATDFSGPIMGPLGESVAMPTVAVVAWAFFAITIFYPVAGNYSLHRTDPEFSLPVLATVAAYAALALFLAMENLYFGIMLLAGIAGATLGMWGAMSHDTEAEVTFVHLLSGYLVSVILLAVFVGLAFGSLQAAGFGVSTTMLQTPQFILVVAVSLLLGTVLGDYLETPSGVVGYFSGTDAVFYSFVLTSFFVLASVWAMGA